MKRTLFILALVCSITLAFAQKQKVAVYVIDEQYGLADYVSAAMVDAMVHNSNYMALERTDAFHKAMTKEHEYQRTGNVDESQIASLGMQFGTPLVCVIKIGTVADKYFMQARLLDAETAVVKNSTKAIIFTLEDVENAASKVVTQLLTENHDSRSIQGAFGN